MGTITIRKRKGGSIAYLANVRLKRDGRVVLNEHETFERAQAARAWIKKRERELAQPGALESAQQEDPALADAIDRYVRESKKSVGRTKAQVLEKIKAAPIGALRCSCVRSQEIVQFAQSLDVQPQTVGNYMSHLAAVFTVARPAWGYPLDERQINDARVVLKKLGQSSRSNARERRPSIGEIDRIMNYYSEMADRERAEIPMREIIVFALFSARRQEEITTIRWENWQRDRVLVRDMKHPGQKKGNDTWCDLPPEAERVIAALPKPEKGKGAIFPYNPRSISASFTKACAFLAIDDLHFHDLRHEGTSRLFEMGWNIPHVAAVTGHRSWNSLKRYTHLRQTGDKWAGWKWLDEIAPVQPAS